jgi:2-iminobutanoate/2-iminopropanoate deaminase
MKLFSALSLTFIVQVFAISASARDLEYIGKPVRNIPVSSAVKVGNLVFVSGTPGYKDGKLAVGDFGAQMKQAMENVAEQLKSAGTGWDRVARTTVMLVRRDDFGEMNRIYGEYFSQGKYPARTTTIVAGLPSAEFLVEVEVEAVLE